MVWSPGIERSNLVDDEDFTYACCAHHPTLDRKQSVSFLLWTIRCTIRSILVRPKRGVIVDTVIVAVAHHSRWQNRTEERQHQVPRQLEGPPKKIPWNRHRALQSLQEAATTFSIRSSRSRSIVLPPPILIFSRCPHHHERCFFLRLSPIPIVFGNLQECPGHQCVLLPRRRCCYCGIIE